MTHHVDPLRRASDRWLVKLAAVAVLILGGTMTFSTVAAGNRAETAAVDRDRIQNTLDRQNADLLCFADTTTEWQLSVTALLLAEVQADPANPVRQDALDGLKRARAELLAAKALCYTRTRTQPPEPGYQPPTGTTTIP